MGVVDQLLHDGNPLYAIELGGRYNFRENRNNNRGANRRWQSYIDSTTNI